MDLARQRPVALIDERLQEFVTARAICDGSLNVRELLSCVTPILSHCFSFRLA